MADDLPVVGFSLSQPFDGNPFLEAVRRVMVVPMAAIAIENELAMSPDCRAYVYASNDHRVGFSLADCPQVRVSGPREESARHEWTLAVSEDGLPLNEPDVVKGRDERLLAGSAARTLRWNVPVYSEYPIGLQDALADWLDRTLSTATVGIRLFAMAEELIGHLRSALDERDELRRRLAKALGSHQHAEDRIRVLESQLSSLELQLLEANAAVAAGDPDVIRQSKGAVRATAAILIGMLALVVAVASPFVSDWLTNDDTQAIVDAQRETTEAIAALDDPSSIELTVETALRCVVDVESGQ